MTEQPPRPLVSFDGVNFLPLYEESTRDLTPGLPLLRGGSVQMEVELTETDFFNLMGFFLTHQEFVEWKYERDERSRWESEGGALCT